MPDPEPLFESLDIGSESGATEPPISPVAAVSEPPRTRVRLTPHKSKLTELLVNDKLPSSDKLHVQAAIERYGQWISDMEAAPGSGNAKLERLVELLNQYKRFVELDLIWNSTADFLFRQRGQLKLDNSIIEEFLPWLVDVDIIPELAHTECFAGPASAFAAVYFSSTITDAAQLLGMRVRTKDQDFTLSRHAFLRASFDSTFPRSATDNSSVWLAYLAAECKTNLDKTMFQEAAATSHDLKVGMPAAKYYLMCEFLDMTPISSAGTDIDEVLILRGKRLGSNIRKAYSSSTNRQKKLSEYLAFLDENPIRVTVISRFVEHLRSLLTRRDPKENDVLERGYF
jgi:hypothetical protein